MLSAVSYVCLCVCVCVCVCVNFSGSAKKASRSRSRSRDRARRRSPSRSRSASADRRKYVPPSQIHFDKGTNCSSYRMMIDNCKIFVCTAVCGSKYHHVCCHPSISCRVLGAGTLVTTPRPVQRRALAPNLGRAASRDRKTGAGRLI